MRVISPKSLTADDQELKEAVCDAIVNLAVGRVSGADKEGEFVYGRTPKRAFVAGLLLPRFNEANEDETSDIRIATLGIDLQIGSTATGMASVQPSFATYVRVLPDWKEISDSRFGLEVDFALDAALEKRIADTIKAERRRRFIAEGLDRADPKDMPTQERQDRQARRRAIRNDVRRSAYAEHGIALTDDDLAPQLDPPPAPVEPAENVDPSTTDTEPVETVSVATIHRNGRKIPLALLVPADIPVKWRRLNISLPAFTWPLEENAGLPSRLAAFNTAMQVAATKCVHDWLASPEGDTQAWRPVNVNPADVASEAAWLAFLQRARLTPPPKDKLTPPFADIRIGIDWLPDYVHADVASLRVTLENGNKELGPRDFKLRCDTIFQAKLELRIPAAAHHPLKLDRVEPSYRFRDHMTYPAMGLNCGVVVRDDAPSKVLTTTWAPRFVQPRILPRSIDIACSYAALADEGFPCASLLKLPQAYLEWVAKQEPSLRKDVRRGLMAADAEAEAARLEDDLAGQRAEARYIERGVQLLIESQQAAADLTSATDPEKRSALERRAMPWRAWLLMNRTFLQREAGDTSRSWRLFQIAFVLAHIPTLASRMPEFRDWHDPELDETSASLLYFPTGGGKSEAFYGTLLYAMFLDRLKGKNRGVTGMVRYPLRLLTLQQAQRFLRLLVHAELIRKKEKLGDWPFEIGFWVGRTNTPNRYAQVATQIPTDDDTSHPDDRLLLPATLPPGTDDTQAVAYEENLLAYNKIPRCPICGGATGLRRITSEGDTAKRLGIFCFNPCEWNTAHGGRAALPFLLTDDAVYQRAPSVIVGTVDKMAMLGQNTDTIAQLLGMFGLARWKGPTGHLLSPRTEDKLEQGPEHYGYRPVFPAYHAGDHIFTDPFPSLVIQDEAHLLEESLGTFSGLFESLLELVFTRIAKLAGNDLHIARAWHNGKWGNPRTPKIIAATATVADPERQLEVLYQRTPLRFPYPGPDIYHSFFSVPAQAPPANKARSDLFEKLPLHQRPEATSPWMRLYVSLMTNGSTHTMTTVSVLAAFHLIITSLWRGLLNPASRVAAFESLRGAIENTPSGAWRMQALDRAIAAGQENRILALVDLHRIALAYVTNKKGGDQIMDALDLQVRRDHRFHDQDLAAFDSRLITGGIDMRTIQQVMSDSEKDFPAGSDYPDINPLVRSVVATSAISHGVDVDRFNSMFFAGLPSDVAEYIQASSRVGRTHVGFVMLIPTPQSRRDRYVVETHDIFHRFLERMIAPPAVQRWAANAIKRVAASIIQTWAILKEAEEFLPAGDSTKAHVRQYDILRQLNALAVSDPLALRDDLIVFALSAIGYPGRGPDLIGKPVYGEVYRKLVDKVMHAFVANVETFPSQSRLAAFWKENSGMQPPMTSLRDVDEAGYIVPCIFDPRAQGGTRRVSQPAFVAVMKAIRRQKGTGAETDRDGETPKEVA